MVRVAERVGLFSCHETGFGQSFQSVHRGACSQFGELSAPHDLEQLHGKFNFADTAARELHVVGTFGVPCRALCGMGSDLLVQPAQAFKDVVVEIASKDKGQDHIAQLMHAVVAPRRKGCDHTALQPRKPLPFAPLNEEIIFEGRQPNGCGADTAIWTQSQVDPKNEAVFGRFADQLINMLDDFCKKFVVADALQTFGVTLRAAIDIVDIDEVDVAGNVEFTGAQLTHAHNPKCGLNGLGGRTFWRLNDGRAMDVFEVGQGKSDRLVQRELSQVCGGQCDVGHAGFTSAIQRGKTLDDQLAQDPEAPAEIKAFGLKGGKGLTHVR